MYWPVADPGGGPGGLGPPFQESCENNVFHDEIITVKCGLRLCLLHCTLSPVINVGAQCFVCSAYISIHYVVLEEPFLEGYICTTGPHLYTNVGSTILRATITYIIEQLSYN